MNISLSKPELVMLLRMVNIGDWVMFADLEGDEMDDPVALAHKKVLQKLFSAAHRAKMDGLVFYEPEDKEYYETREFEEDYQEFINKFNNSQFWEMLADRLAMRDLVEQMGGAEAVESMDWMQRGGRLSELADNYEEGFVKHGLQRIRLLNTLDKDNV